MDTAKRVKIMAVTLSPPCRDRNKFAIASPAGIWRGISYRILLKMILFPRNSAGMASDINTRINISKVLLCLVRRIPYNANSNKMKLP